METLHLAACAAGHCKSLPSSLTLEHFTLHRRSTEHLLAIECQVYVD